MPNVLESETRLAMFWDDMKNRDDLDLATAVEALESDLQSIFDADIQLNK